MFQSLPGICSKEAPSPLWEATVFTLDIILISKCVFLLASRFDIEVCVFC